ncbi:unnamed protein product [Caretta caretta]
MRLGRQDPAQERSRAGWLWGLLCGQQRPQEPSPDSQHEALPCLVTEDLPASPGQKVEDPCPSTSSSACSPWDSSSAWVSSSSQADGRHCFVPGTARVSEDSEDEEEEEEWVDVVTEEAALKNIREQLQGREKEVIEELPDDSPTGAVLANSLIAVGNLRICIGSCQTSWMPCWGICWQNPQAPTGSTTSWSILTTGSCPGCREREPGPLGASQPCITALFDPPSPSLSSTTQPNSAGWLTTWHSWLCLPVGLGLVPGQQAPGLQEHSQSGGERVQLCQQQDKLPPPICLSPAWSVAMTRQSVASQAASGGSNFGWWLR